MDTLGTPALLPLCHSQLPTSIKCGVGTFGKLRFFPSPSTLRGPFPFSLFLFYMFFFLHILIVNGREGFRRLLCGNPHDYDALLDERVDLGQNAEPIELGNNGGKRREGFGIEFHLVENMRAMGTGRAPMSSAECLWKNRRKKAGEGERWHGPQSLSSQNYGDLGRRTKRFHPQPAGAIAPIGHTRDFLKCP
jgi:hypothetical protein